MMLQTASDPEPIRAVRVHASEAELPEGPRRALRALQRAIDQFGELSPATSPIPPGVRSVGIEAWRAAAYAAGISRSTERRAMQVAFRRAIDKLTKARLVTIRQGNAFLTPPAGQR